MLTPNRYPIKADIAMAIVPQIHILHTDLPIEDPPTFAARVPDMARKSMENPYWKKIICFRGAKTESSRGNIPPTINEVAAVTPIARLVVDRIPSLAPNTEALSHPLLFTK
jgi:hypothetical protein